MPAVLLRNEISGSLDSTRRDRSHSRRAFGTVVLAALLLSCGGKAPDSGQLTLVLEGPNSTNPLADPNVASVYIEIDDSGAAVLVSQSFAAGSAMELEHVPYGPARTFKIQTRESTGAALLSGQAGPIDVVKGDHLVVTVLMQ